MGLELLHLFRGQGGGHESEQVRGLRGGDNSHTGEACASPSLQQPSLILRAPREALDSRLNLLRLHSNTSDLDLPVRSPHNLDLPGLPPSQVPGQVHAAELGELDEFLGGGLGEVPIPVCELAAEDDLTGAPCGDLLALLVQDPHIAPRLRPPHRRHLPRPHPRVHPLPRHRPHRRRRLTRPVDIVDLRREVPQAHAALGHGDGEALADGHDVLQARELPPRGVDVEEEVQDLRGHDQGGDLLLGDGVAEVHGVLVPRGRGDDELGTSHQGREELPLHHSPDERSLQECNAARGELAEVCHGVRPVVHVLVGVDDPFGLTSGPAGVENDGGVRQRHNGQLLRLRCRHGRAPHQQGRPINSDLRLGAGQLRHRLAQAGLRDHHLGLAVPDELELTLGGNLRINGDPGGPCQKHCVGCDHHVSPTEHVQRNNVPLLHPQSRQLSGHATHSLR
mmetsp:Transcript_84518/g.225864  ORF Transcript_84518/g.225864 Transcript_84518/m.225864 type:complete len:450 (+) Transcript_84518:1726-3075(+)